MFKPGNTTAHDRKAAVVIVVPKKTCLSSPHGIEVTSLEPFLIDGLDVDVGVRDKAGGILPVVRVENFRDRMRGAAPLESFQPCEKDGIADNAVAVSMIFVPACTPVSHHNLRFMLADCVTNSQRTLFIEGDLTIRVGEEDSIDAEQAGRLLSGRALHYTVLIDGDVFRGPPLSERKVHQYCRSSALGLLGKYGAHREQPVSRMSGDPHDLAGERGVG